MKGQFLDCVDLGSNAREQLELKLAQGRPVKFDATAFIPPSVMTLNLPGVLGRYGQARAHPLDSRRHGTLGTVADICAPIVARDRLPKGEVFVCEFNPLVGNGLLAEIAPALHNDLSNMPLLAGWKYKSTVLWFGGGSPLSHYDPWDNLFVQLAGRKRIVVYDPQYTSRFPKRSSITPRDQTYGKITGARAEGVPYYESWIEAGQAVLIPCGALHALAGSWNSLSLNCFLSGGPRPRFRRHHYRYLAQFSLPREIFSLIPRPFCNWLEQRFKFGTLSFWHGQRTAFPFAFPWTLARRLRTGRA